MADLLPAFPLSLVAFPGEELNLHIFEPRYKQLMHECEKNGITFTVVPYFEGKKTEYAAEMKLLEIAKMYPDGKMDVKTKGVGLCKIIDFFDRHPNKLYPGIEMERLEWDDDADIVITLDILDQLTSLYETMHVDNVKIKSPGDFRTYQVAHKVGFSVDQELEFLKISSERERQTFMLEHIKNIMPVIEEMEVLKRRAAMNGHFKNVIPKK